MTLINRFNIRVYGVWIHKGEVMVTDERMGGYEFTKFPGGGLEYGEGLFDGLKREFMEEMNQPVEIVEHLYTTDFFQRSAFKETDQLISVYYKVNPIGELTFELSKLKKDFKNEKGDEICFRMIPLSELRIEDLTYPIDQIVAKQLLS